MAFYDLSKEERNVVVEIVDVHDRYKRFAILTQQAAIKFIDGNYNQID